MLSLVLLMLMTGAGGGAAEPRWLSAAAAGAAPSAAAEPRVLKIRDAGQRFALGELYDARIEQRVSGRLYSSDLIQQNTYETSGHMSYTDVAHSDSIREKRRLMGISAELALKMNLLVASFEASGGVGYLLDKRWTSKSVRMATSFQTRTVKEKLDIFADEMLEGVNRYPLGDHERCASRKEACQKATHVVTSITWGADVFVVFENLYETEYDRERLQLYLRTKLGVPIGPSIKFESEFSIDTVEYEKLNRTRVKTFGDVRFARPLPTNIDEALDFVKSLPEETDTMIGRGVPMEVELTPLVWLHDDAAGVVGQIDEDTIERLTDIFEDFETSEAKILDMVNTGYAGFISWKASADAYHNDFRVFRSNYSADLSAAMQQFQGGSADRARLLQLEQDYLRSDFRWPAVQAAVEARLDALGNLLASVATMEGAGVSFASSISDFFGPTFDSRFDRVYGLVLVGPSPASNRKGIENIRDFAQLAKARRIKDAVPEHPDVVRHCVEALVVGRAETRAKCREHLAFVAVDFESFCTAFCPAAFCQLDPASKRVCPASVNSTPPCELSAEDADSLRCDVNDFVGKCGTDGAHDISNYEENPNSHCWCACPQTMILEWYHSRPARGLREAFPRVPRRPQLLDPPVVGHDDPELGPNHQVMSIRLDTSHDDGAYNYRATVSWKEQIQEGSLTSFVAKQWEVETPGRRSVITLRGLVAGREYRIEVTPLNSEGAGEPVVLPGWYKVAYRMATVHFPTNGHHGHQHNTGPSWLDLRAQIQLSTPSYDAIARVTIHTSREPRGSIDVRTFAEGQDNVTIEGLDCTGASSTGISCLLPLSELSSRVAAGEELELRVWDAGEILAAISTIRLVDPSAAECQRYGSRNRFCPSSSGGGSCVQSCYDCSIYAVPVGATCREPGCEARQFWCPATASCINYTVDTGDVCERWCRDADGVGADTAEFQTGPPQNVVQWSKCVSRCNLTLPDGFPQGAVGRGDSVEIDCIQPYFRTHGRPLIFTCPPAGSTDRADEAFQFDTEMVLLNSNGSMLPQCGRCNDDQDYDPTEGTCRSRRHQGPAWNYLWNGDLEDYDEELGAPASFAVDGAGGAVARKDQGANGLGHALEFKPTTGGQVRVSQKLSLSLLKSDGDAVPPVGSVWKASLLYQILSSGGVSSSLLAELCLRDREPPETPARQCVSLPAVEGSTAWHRVEVRFTVQTGAALLALDVVAQGGHFAVDHVMVGPVSGFEELAPSPRDIAQEARRATLAEVNPSLEAKSDRAQVEELEEAFARRLREESTLEEEVRSHHGQIQALQQEKAAVSECRMCMQQTGIRQGCEQCTCGTFCTGWTRIGIGYSVGDRTDQILDDTHDQRGGCLRQYWVECRAV